MNFDALLQLFALDGALQPPFPTVNCGLKPLIFAFFREDCFQNLSFCQEKRAITETTRMLHPDQGHRQGSNPLFGRDVFMNVSGASFQSREQKSTL